MAATISSSGTWTVLNLDVTSAPQVKTGMNVPGISNAQLEQLKNTGYPELLAFIQLMADGLGIGFQHAKSLCLALLTAETNRESPTVRTGVYVP